MASDEIVRETLRDVRRHHGLEAPRSVAQWEAFARRLLGEPLWQRLEVFRLALGLASDRYEREACERALRRGEVSGGSAAWLNEAVELARADDLQQRFYAFLGSDTRLQLVAVAARLPLYEALLPALLQSLPAHLAPRRVLDVGCFAGVVACVLARCWPGAEIVGVDAEPRWIAFATELASSLRLANVRFEAAAFEDLRAPCSFDLIVWLFVGLPVDDAARRDAAFGRMYTLLSEHGRVLLLERWEGLQTDRALRAARNAGFEITARIPVRWRCPAESDEDQNSEAFVLCRSAADKFSGHD